MVSARAHDADDHLLVWEPAPKLRRPSPGKALCRVCGKTYALTVAGTLRQHDRRIARCPGSGATPTEETETR